MLRLLYSMLIPLCLFAERGSELFPIPLMQEHWTGSGLSSNDDKLLSRAIKADLSSCTRSVSGQDGDGELDFASLALGKLGKGVLVRAENSCSCGATGNCAIYLYVQKEGRYRHISFCGPSGRRIDCDDCEPSGWAFSEVDSSSGVPDLVIASNAGAGENDLVLYRYQDGKFMRRKCERLLARADRTPRNWWDASEVVVHPCQSS